MRVALFSTKSYDEKSLIAANEHEGHELVFFEARLTPKTCSLASGFPCVSVFVNDVLNKEVLQQLHANGTRLVALRCAGFNNVDIRAAEELGITVVRVPEYSPHAVAEHTVALIISLSRHIHKAYQRGHFGNFSLEGLMGIELHGRTVGIIGTGKIGYLVAKILKGFGCKLLGYDLAENQDCLALGMKYTALDELYASSDIITLHCPLTTNTHHLINDAAFAKMRDRVMLINTGRGAIIDSQAAINAIKSGKLGYLGLDVYEQESEIFFENLSDEVIADDVFQRLLSFPNVLITGHQGYFTDHAISQIAKTTIQNLTDFESGNPSGNGVGLEHVR